MDENVRLIPSEVPPIPDNDESYVEFEPPAPQLFAATAAKTYTLTVDVTNQVVSAYENGTTLVRQMVCSTGKDATPTPKGSFTTSSQYRWGYFDKFDCWAQYWTRINGPYLFHSVLYKKKDESTLISSSVANLGSKASHGCVRLRVVDAQWIYENCKSGTKVRISAEPKDALFASKVKAAGALSGSSLYVKQVLPSIGKGIVKTAGGKLNLRAAPSTSAAILGSLNNGSAFDLLKVEGSWYLIRVGADEGYISKDFAALSGGTTPSDPGTISPPSTGVIAVAKVKVSSGSLNLRASASTSSSILTQLSNGTELEVLAYSGGWAKVQYKGAVGYVSLDYIAISSGQKPQ